MDNPMATIPGDHRRTISGRELVFLATFAVFGAGLALLEAAGGLP